MSAEQSKGEQRRREEERTVQHTTAELIREEKNREPVIKFYGWIQNDR
jgi:hypothetical protein